MPDVKSNICKFCGNDCTSIMNICSDCYSLSKAESGSEAFKRSLTVKHNLEKVLSREGLLKAKQDLYKEKLRRQGKKIFRRALESQPEYGIERVG